MVSAEQLSGWLSLPTKDVKSSCLLYNSTYINSKETMVDKLSSGVQNLLFAIMYFSLVPLIWLSASEFLLIYNSFCCKNK